MKKNVITVIALVLIVASLVSVGFTAVKMTRKASAYARVAEGVIIEVIDEVVAVETADGNVWEFEGEGYEVGQRVEVVFSNNGSPDFYKDDVIQWVG
jgi:hypothetical protein